MPVRPESNTAKAGGLSIYLAPIAPVLLAVTFAQAALGLMTTLIPLLLIGRGVSSGVIGLISSAYYIGFLLGAGVMSRLVAKVGHIRASAVFAAVAAIAAQVLALTDDPWGWAAARAILGLNMAGLFLVIESWLNDKATSRNRGRIFGAYLMIDWLASALGPFALNVVPASATLFVPVGMAFVASLLPMALTPVPNPYIGRHAILGPRRLLRISPLGTVCCLAAGAVNSTFYALTPVYLEQLHYSTREIAAFASATLIAGLVVQYPIGMLTDRVGRRQVTLATLLMCFSLTLVLGFATHASFPALTIIGSLFAGIAAPLYGLGVGQVNDRIDRSAFVAASGGLLMAWAIGATLGPSIAGAIMAKLGPMGLIVYFGGVLAAVGAFTVLRMQVRPDAARKSGFVPAATTPPSLGELDPRAEDAAAAEMPGSEMPGGEMLDPADDGKPSAE